MTSGQWDLNALEALEREALEVFEVLEVPERVRRSSPNAPIQTSSHSHSHHHHHQHQLQHRTGVGVSGVGGTVAGVVVGACIGGATEDLMDIELEDHIKHCSCTCNHMGYGNFMDYQVIAFYFMITIFSICFNSSLSDSHYTKLLKKEKTLSSRGLFIYCTRTCIFVEFNCAFGKIFLKK